MISRDETDWDACVTSNKGGFEGANPSADGWTVSAQSYDTSIKLIGSKSIGWTASNATGNPGALLYNANGDSGVEIRNVAWYTRNDVSVGNDEWCQNYQKIWNNYPSPDPLIGLNFNFIGNNATAYTSVGISEDGGDYTSGSIPGGAIQSGKWYHMELQFNPSSPYDFKCWINGTLTIDDNLSGDQGQQNDGHNFDLNRQGTGFDQSNYGCRTNWDDVVISSSRIYPACKVEISDNSTYGSGTLVYQYPTTIGDSSTVVICDLTGLGAGPYYMFVTNGQNQRVTTAYNLSGGGSSAGRGGSSLSYFR